MFENHRGQKTLFYFFSHKWQVEREESKKKLDRLLYDQVYPSLAMLFVIWCVGFFLALNTPPTATNFFIFLLFTILVHSEYRRRQLEQQQPYYATTNESNLPNLFDFFPSTLSSRLPYSPNMNNVNNNVYAQVAQQTDANQSNFAGVLNSSMAQRQQMQQQQQPGLVQQQSSSPFASMQAMSALPGSAFQVNTNRNNLASNASRASSMQSLLSTRLGNGDNNQGVIL